MTDLQERPAPWPPPDPGRRRVDPWPPPRRTASGRLADPRRPGRWPSACFYSWWALVLVVGFLLMLFVHELGHYLAARRAGMKVTEFFLGFGPRIWSFRRGETEYGLKAIPARRLRPHHRDEQPRGGRRRPTSPAPSGQGLLEPVSGGRGRRGHELRAGPRAAVRGHGRLRRAEGRAVGGQRRVGQQPGGQAAGLQPGDQIVGRRRQPDGHLRPS